MNIYTAEGFIELQEILSKYNNSMIDYKTGILNGAPAAAVVLDNKPDEKMIEYIQNNIPGFIKQGQRRYKYAPEIVQYILFFSGAEI